MSGEGGQSEAGENPFEYREVESVPSSRWVPLRRSPSGLQSVYTALFMFLGGVCGVSRIGALLTSRWVPAAQVELVAVGCMVIAAGLKKDRRWALWIASVLCSALVPIGYVLLREPWISVVAVVMTVGWLTS